MKKSSINNGLFLGIAMIISSYALYLANPSMFFGAKAYVLFIIFILIAIKSGLEAKKQNGGTISFSEAFKNIFITGAIGTLLCTCFEYLHLNFISPELVELQKELALEAAEQAGALLEGFGPEFEEAMELQIEKIEDGNLASISTTIKNLLIRLIAPTALLAALISLFIKTKMKPMDNLDDKEKRYIVNK